MSLFCAFGSFREKTGRRKIANVGNNFSSAPLKGQEEKKEKRERIDSEMEDTEGVKGWKEEKTVSVQKLSFK